MSDFLLSALSGLIGGLIVWIVQQFYSNRRERLIENRQNVVIPLNQNKVVNSAILQNLRPGNSLSLAFQMLGQAVKETQQDVSVISDQTVLTNSYIYTLSNANIKITSKNSTTIDSLTILPNDTSFILENMPNPLNASEITLNKTIIGKTIAEDWHHTVIVARHDETFVISMPIANPFYQTFTYFGYFAGSNFMGNWKEYQQSNNPLLFIGGLLIGICISVEPNEAFYIYKYEMR